jgi:uncharacterized protein
MTTRRGFLASILAASAVPSLTWADAGSPAFLAAAREPDGNFALFGLTAAGQDTFRIPLPTRGHAAAGHPTAPEAVAFARRPGTFAFVINCVDGQVMSRLEAPQGRHFYGHGTFSADGDILFTTENDYDAGQGVIGLWQRSAGYQRVGEIASGGIGPHDILRLPGTQNIVVANGGILTHPDSDRENLNPDTMQPNLSYLDPSGAIDEVVTLDPALHQNSIRHLATARDGTVAFAMQWEGDPTLFPPLLGLHRRGESPVLAMAPDGAHQRMQGYAGSVGLSGDGTQVAITSPKGGLACVFGIDGAYAGLVDRTDICGIGSGPDGFMVTDGLGGVSTIRDGTFAPLGVRDRAWDNHLIRLAVG